MLAAKGIALTPISERLLGDVAGIVMKERVWRTLQSKYGTVEVTRARCRGAGEYRHGLY